MSDLRAERRNINREKILLELHQAGPLQRIALSDRLDLRANSVGSIVGELLEWGVLTEPDGSPANRLALNPSGPFFLAVYLGVHGTVIARVYFDGRVEEHARLDTGASPDALLEALTPRLHAAVGEDEARLCGIGVTLPGFVDNRRGVVVHAVNLMGWHGIPVAERLRREFERIVLVENESRCHLWNDVWFRRRAIVLDTILNVFVIEGISCAVLVDGKLLQGRNAASGEIGHVPCDTEGRICACGKQDCLEAYCSEPELLAEAKALGLAPPACARLAELVDRMPYHVGLTMFFDRAAMRFVRGLAPVIAAFDPAEMIIACRDLELAEALREPIRHRLREMLVGLPAHDLAVDAASVSPDTALRGIAGLLMEKYFKQIGEMKPLPAGRLPVVPE